MDTKSKKYRKVLYLASFWTCVISLLGAIASGMTMFAFEEGFQMRYGLSYWETMFPYEYAVDFPPEGEQLRVFLIISLIATVGFALLCLITFVTSIWYVGQRDENGEIIIKKVDKIPTEVQMGTVLFFFAVGSVATVSYLFTGIGKTVGPYFGIIFRAYQQYTAPAPVAYSLASVAGFLSAAIGFWMFISMIRKLKAGAFLKYSIFGMLLFNPLKDTFYGGSVKRKVVLLTLAVCLLSATVFLAPVVAIVILLYAPKWVDKYEAIKKGVEEVKEGNFGYKIDIEGEGELAQLAQNINQITEASNKAIQNELRNQKMKTELISNVSHDLKTPITSLVTYIDLLKKEGLDSENAPKYIEILEQKTRRLRTLTEDLFEAAKASSGAIPIELANVDVASLINQTLGEMDEKIQSSGLEFIFSSPEEKYFALADGQQLWRVAENLIGNVIKYAQPGSRVYIDIREGEVVPSEGIDSVGAVIIEIKNISKQQLNVDADTLMERFTRGDTSRTTEGSGLGLAISKDLVKLMGGEFEIFIDGDLFKARVILRKS